MGTSKSSGGPKGTFALLPPWAPDPIPALSSTPVPMEPEDLPAVSGSEASETPSPVATTTDSQTGVAVATPFGPRMANLSSARRRMTKFTTGGGGTGRARAAGRSYVKGRGGASGATKSATSGRAAAASLGGFLSSVARNGWQATARAMGLEQYVGKSINTTLAAIVNILAPNGALVEESAARTAVNQAMYELYDQFDLGNGDLSKLDNLDETTVRGVLQSSVVTYIYTRWLGELGDRIESKSVSDEQAVKLEREVKDYVRETVKLDMAKVNVLALDWSGQEGQRFVERIFSEAYGFLEAE